MVHKEDGGPTSECKIEENAIKYMHRTEELVSCTAHKSPLL